MPNLETRRIVFVVQSPLTRRDYRRHGIEYLQRQGGDIRVIDVTALIFPNVAPRPSDPVEACPVPLTICRSHADWINCNEYLLQATLTVCLVGSGYVTLTNLPILRAISRAPGAFMLFMTNLHPQPRVKSRAVGIVARIKRFRLWPSLLARVPLRLLGVRHVDYVVHGGRKTIVARPLVGPQSKLIVGHSTDYEACLAATSVPETQSNTAVFLDQNFGFHRDPIASGIRQPASAELFYSALRKFFDRIEAELGVAVVIAAHPRSGYDSVQKLFGDRKVVKERTAELIKESNLVIACYSTAIGMAVWFGKPLVMIATKEVVSHPNLAGVVESFAHALGKDIIFIDEPDAFSTQDMRRIDRNRYDAYVEDFIKMKSSPELPLWDIILQNIGLAEPAQTVSAAR
jgi:hypothetical protein